MTTDSQQLPFTTMIRVRMVILALLFTPLVALSQSDSVDDNIARLNAWHQGNLDRLQEISLRMQIATLEKDGYTNVAWGITALGVGIAIAGIAIGSGLARKDRQLLTDTANIDATATQ